MLMWMAYATLAGALLAAAGAVLERYSPWLAGHRRLLWLAVICGTLAFAAAASVLPGRSDIAVTPESQSLPATRTASPPDSPALVVTDGGTIAPPSQAVAPLRSAPRDPVASVDALLLIVWLAGSALCLAVLATSAWRVTRMRRTWRESVLAGVPVLVSHDVGPAVIGLVHHGIVVPAWVETLGADQQHTVMTHEREHVRAGDPLLLWGATLLVAVAPWNAALWYALRRLRHAIEMDCDARVLRSRPDARAYCTLLLDVGERTLAGVAPVAALAEPSTLLERRIEAMTLPMRTRRRSVAGGASVAMALLAAACITPRPQVAPAARISALVAELSSLLARDSVRRSISPADRQRMANVLHAAGDSVLGRGEGAEVGTGARSARDSVARMSASIATHDSTVFEGGPRVVKLARDSFPEVFQAHDGAIAVLTVYDSAFHPIRNYVQRFRLDEIFDVVPGLRDSVVGMRGTSYVLSRVIPGWRPQLTMSGSQFEGPNTRAVFLWAVLMPGQAPPRAQDPEDRAKALAPDGGGGTRIELRTADSVARSLYPETFVSHDGLPVVGLIFSQSGQLLRRGIRHVSHDEVFVPTREADTSHGESARGGDELLSLVFTGMPERAGRWSTVAHRSGPAPALVWTVLPANSSLPSPRVDTPTRDIAGQTASLAHREAHVTLSGTGAGERWIRVYATAMNAVEAGAVRGTVRDTLRLRLPSTLTIDLGPGDGVTFESEDGQPFKLSALIAGKDVPASGSGGRLVLEGSGAGLKAFR